MGGDFIAIHLLTSTYTAPEEVRFPAKVTVVSGNVRSEWLYKA